MSRVRLRGMDGLARGVAGPGPAQYGLLLPNSRFLVNVSDVSAAHLPFLPAVARPGQVASVQRNSDDFEPIMEAVPPVLRAPNRKPDPSHLARRATSRRRVLARRLKRTAAMRSWSSWRRRS
jgi:hypothetical protein